ncbi:hypothetical protein H4O18_14995 [Arenibacter sp. BSSL-BM3]|uniref:Uncharacterized protein n=1 Tax=Arenibacter arenosicollis TaxID=2762274 RepID=A0ABR7QQ26_9FLAO|nr:hypothetical protein [Arenibacter arenosicollis]MBC8769302.1 hypothetical protein [Arenibacter arenosicollis]
MKKTILFILALSGIFASAQELDCTDFSNGTFLVHTSGATPVTWRLVREGNLQTEYKEEIQGNEQGTTDPKMEYSKIEWIND